LLNSYAKRVNLITEIHVTSGETNPIPVNLLETCMVHTKWVACSNWKKQYCLTELPTYITGCSRNNVTKV